MPWNIDCVVCGGKNSHCIFCENGKHKIIECPMLFITPDIYETIRLTDLWFKGIPPIAGGSLDQSRSFYDAAGFILGETNYWKNKLGILT